MTTSTRSLRMQKRTRRILELIEAAPGAITINKIGVILGLSESVAHWIMRKMLETGQVHVADDTGSARTFNVGPGPDAPPVIDDAYIIQKMMEAGRQGPMAAMAAWGMHRMQ